jgi:peptidoglycan hydrolase CwlO-like protein
MINLEQVKLLEAKVAKAIDLIEQLAKENADLHKNEAELQTRLETYQKRIDELEGLVMTFKEDQGRIEDAILAALNKLNQFEETVEKSLWDRSGGKGSKAAVKEARAAAADGKTCFEIPSAEAWQGAAPAGEHPSEGGDIADPLEDTAGSPEPTDGSPAEKDGELDIY